MTTGAHPNQDGFVDFCGAIIGQTVHVYTTATKRESVTGELLKAFEGGITVKSGSDEIFINRDGIVALYKVTLPPSNYGNQS